MLASGLAKSREFSNQDLTTTVFVMNPDDSLTVHSQDFYEIVDVCIRASDDPAVERVGFEIIVKWSIDQT